MKADGHGPVNRGEWETEVGDLKPDLRNGSDSPLKKLGAKKLRRELKPVFKTVVHRTVVPLRSNQAEIELAIDRGKVVSGRKVTSLAELELELKSGRLSDLFHLARTIERHAQAELYLASKSDRGFSLTGDKATPAPSAAPFRCRTTWRQSTLSR